MHGDQVDEPWVQYDGASLASSARSYLHADHQGSIIAHSNSEGGVAAVLAYDAYGIPAEGNIDRFGYTGQIWLKELGLFHYKARVYSLKLGRFLQTDPIFYADNMNMYAYVGNDPMNNADSSGMKCEGTGDKSVCTVNQINIARSGRKANWVNREDGLKSGKISERKLAKLEKI